MDLSALEKLLKTSLTPQEEHHMETRHIQFKQNHQLTFETIFAQGIFQQYLSSPTHFLWGLILLGRVAQSKQNNNGFYKFGWQYIQHLNLLNADKNKEEYRANFVLLLQGMLKHISYEPILSRDPILHTGLATAQTQRCMRDAGTILSLAAACLHSSLSGDQAVARIAWLLATDRSLVCIKGLSSVIFEERHQRIVLDRQLRVSELKEYQNIPEEMNQEFYQSPPRNAIGNFAVTFLSATQSTEGLPSQLTQFFQNIWEQDQIKFRGLYNWNSEFKQELAKIQSKPQKLYLLATSLNKFVTGVVGALPLHLINLSEETEHWYLYDICQILYSLLNQPEKRKASVLRPWVEFFGMVAYLFWCDLIFGDLMVPRILKYLFSTNRECGEFIQSQLKEHMRSSTTKQKQLNSFYQNLSGWPREKTNISSQLGLKEWRNKHLLKQFSQTPIVCAVNMPWRPHLFHQNQHNEEEQCFTPEHLLGQDVNSYADFSSDDEGDVSESIKKYTSKTSIIS
jgi:hypothetical protein